MLRMGLERKLLVHITCSDCLLTLTIHLPQLGHEERMETDCYGDTKLLDWTAYVRVLTGVMFT